MRFIIRTQAKQAHVEGKEPFSENPDDYVVIIDGPVVGRIYSSPVHHGRWVWALQSPTGSVGYADSLDEAKKALKQKWFEETKKLSKH